MTLLVTAVLSPAATTGASTVPRPVQFEQRIPNASVAAAARARRAVRGVARTGRHFDLVGLRWSGAAAASVQVRTRRTHGWSRWTAVPVDPEHGPDMGSAEAEAAGRGSDPVWSGDSNAIEYQLRPRGPIRDLRLSFLNTEGTATAAARRHRVRMSRARTVVPAPGAPPIITRDEWGAATCPPRTTPAYGDVKLAFVHHTVTTNDYTPDQSAAIVRGICLYHRNTNGWNDLGYNFLVDRYGQVFEGRAGGIDAAVVGAQAQGYNTQSTGISNLGTFSTAGQTTAGLDALARLIGWKLSIHGVPSTGTVVVTSGGGSLNRYPSGRPVTFQRISGHRDGDATACPGDGLYAQLPQLRQMVSAESFAPRPAIAFAARSATITYGAKASLAGRLTAPGGGVLTGQPVEIQLLGRVGAWKTLHSVTTDPSGSFATNVRLSYNHALRARFAGGSGFGPVQSRSLVIGVRPLVTAELAPTAAETVTRGGRISVRGRVKPAKRNVLLLVDRLRGPSKRRFGKRVVRARAGRARATFRFTKAGSYVVRLAVVPDGRNIGGRSHAIRITVR
jgi:N-acetylmuramoyl-L-alanine amidase